VGLWNGEGAACMHMHIGYMEMSTHGLMQCKLYNDQYGWKSQVSVTFWCKSSTTIFLWKPSHTVHY